MGEGGPPDFNVHSSAPPVGKNGRRRNKKNVRGDSKVKMSRFQVNSPERVVDDREGEFEIPHDPVDAAVIQSDDERGEGDLERGGEWRVSGTLTFLQRRCRLGASSSFLLPPVDQT
jgi:hypothetical protein